MCYNAAYSIEKNLKHAISREQDPGLKKKLEEMLENWRKKKLPFVPPIKIDDVVHFTNAFEHAYFPAFYLDNGERQLGFFRWGLIPRWCKDEKKALQLWNQTINARSETIFDKPSYRASAYDRRCVIMLDGFFEYHHKGKSTFPFYIQPTEGAMFVAGLYENTTIGTETWRTFTIVTTEGNSMMKRIHNNPKNPNRMPVLLRYEQIDEWLKPIDKENKLAKDWLNQAVFIPAPDDMIKAHTVAKLQGKAGLGNVPEAQAEFPYLALDLD